MSRKGLQPAILVVFGLNLNLHRRGGVGSERGKANLCLCFVSLICFTHATFININTLCEGQVKLKHTAHIQTEYTLYINDTFVVTLNNVHRILFIRTSHTSETYCKNVSKNTHLIKGSVQLGLKLYEVCNHTHTVKFTLLCEKMQERIHSGFKTK